MVKSFFKKILKYLHLYDLFACWYHMYKQWKPGYFSKQLKFRFKGAPDGYPVPSSLMSDKIIARGWAVEYFNLGREAANDIVDFLAGNGLDINDFRHILDFGCGCGRIIRHMRSRTRADLYGSDYNPRLIKWCSRKLKFAEFSVNGLEPPLSYADEQFDFIYLISVFTHLNKDLQIRWMEEFHRILKPGGIVLFTAHGDKYFEFFTPDQIEAFRRGEIVIIDKDEEGTNHFGAFESLEFVKENLLNGFELVAFQSGKANLVQDTYLVAKSPDRI